MVITGLRHLLLLVILLRFSGGRRGILRLMPEGLSRVKLVRVRLLLLLLILMILFIMIVVVYTYLVTICIIVDE